MTNEDITESIFLKAMKWCQIQGSRDALNNSVHWCELNKWEKEFTNIPNSELLPLLISANYLKVQGLIRLLVKVVAKKVQSKTGALQKYFDVENPKWSLKELKTLEGDVKSSHLMQIYMISQTMATKGQIKPKADWCVVDSPKKRKNEFVFSCSEKQKSKKTFVRSLGESVARQSAYGLI